MGIVETVLSEFELSSGNEVRIEHNLDGRVHIHIDNMQLALTKDDFFILSEAVDNSNEKLNEIKDQYDG